MKIGIFGTGRMASALGEQWAIKGHEVCFGSRDPARAKDLASTIERNTRGGSLTEAAAFADVLLLASIWSGVPGTLQAAGNLANKVLIDCTLPLVDMQLAVAANSSGYDEICKLAPTARVVKAFHTIPYNHFADPSFAGISESMFYCGNDIEAKAIVQQLATDIGLDGIDCGPAFIVRQVEGMALVWIFLSAGMGHGDTIGLKLLRR